MNEAELYMKEMQDRRAFLKTFDEILKQNRRQRELLSEACKTIKSMSRYCLGANCDHCSCIRINHEGLQTCKWCKEDECSQLIGGDID